MSAPVLATLGNETALPLVLGVTGHRHLVNRDSLQKAVSALLGELQKQFAHTPLVLLSSLAEGADRLVAEAAREHNIPVVGVLPMSRSLYEADFEGNSREQFNLWLDKQVHCWFELPTLPGSTEETLRVPGSKERLRQYALAGEYVARHSQVLLALWDGLPGKEGGTAEVFAYKLKGEPVLPGSTRLSPLQPIEPALICHLVTPKEKEPPPARALQLDVYFRGCVDETGAERTRRDRNVSLEALAAGAQGHPRPAWQAFWRAFGRVEQFNRDGVRLAHRLAKQRAKSEDFCLGKPADWPPALHGALRPLALRYTLADTLSGHYQSRLKWTLWGLYVMVLLALVPFELHAHHLVPAAAMLGVFLLLLVGAYAVHWWSRYQDYQNKHQDYRALAEGLRIQLFWRLAGLSEVQASVADHYLLEHASELDWIRCALRTWGCCWNGPSEGKKLCPDEPPASELDFVVKHWVGGQATFFRKKAKDLHRTERRLHFWTRPVVVVSVLLVAAAIVLWWLQEHLARPHLADAGSHAGAWAFAGQVVLLVVSLLLVATALVHEYYAKLALAEQLKSYRRMRALFAKARRILQERLAQRTSAQDQEVRKQVQELLQQLVEEALAENGDWVLLRRGRPVDVPRF